MKTVHDFLKTAGTYYLATVEGDQARVRPFGTIHIFEDKLYIQTGKGKAVARQIQESPKVELCAMHEGQWLRLSGTLVEDDRAEAQESMLDAYPNLKAMYTAGPEGNTLVYYFQDAEATFCSFTAAPRTVRF